MAILKKLGSNNWRVQVRNIEILEAQFRGGAKVFPYSGAPVSEIFRV